MKKLLMIIFQFIMISTLMNCNSQSNSDYLESKYQIFWLVNHQGSRIKVTDFGARVMEFWVEDKNGEFRDIVLGFESPNTYETSPEPYFGAAIGRYGNRIANGRFQIEGKHYHLEKNNGENSLHGGPNGFHNVKWEVLTFDQSTITFKYISMDGEEGFPGNLEVIMKYELTEDNEFKINYQALTDQTTVVNLTHHSFFNLNGAGEGDILDHTLMLNAAKYVPVDQGLIPMGEPQSVFETPFDFSNPKEIGRDINMPNEQLQFGGGYDHNWIIDRVSDKVIELAARIYAPKSGIVMEVFTNEPGIQFYSGNFLDNSITGKEEKRYQYRGAFCLETQHFPDSPNRPDFPSTKLSPGMEYKHTCIYKISLMN